MILDITKPSLILNFEIRFTSYPDILPQYVSLQNRPHPIKYRFIICISVSFWEKFSPHGLFHRNQLIRLCSQSIICTLPHTAFTARTYILDYSSRSSLYLNYTGRSFNAVLYLSGRSSPCKDIL